MMPSSRLAESTHGAAWQALGVPAPSAAAALAGADVDVLFRAALARIVQALDEDVAAGSVAPDGNRAPLVRATVLECVSDMAQLHTMLSHEAGRRRQLEDDIRDLRGLLSGLQAELSGSRASEIEARHRASHDALTRLPNAAFFRARLDDELAQGGTQPLAVLFVDVDRFKAINDEHGHEVGDAVLRIVAGRLSGGVRGGDLASRFGGDEFVCMLGGVASRQHLGRLVRKLALRLASPLSVDHLVLDVRASIGVAVFPVDGLTSAELLRNADIAMYAAKRQACGVAFFRQPPAWPAASTPGQVNGNDNGDGRHRPPGAVPAFPLPDAHAQG